MKKQPIMLTRLAATPSMQGTMLRRPEKLMPRNTAKNKRKHIELSPWPAFSSGQALSFVSKQRTRLHTPALRMFPM
jgi:hypothetical protein